MNTPLKLFVAGGVPFALFMGVYYALRSDIRTGLIAGLAGGIAFGFFLALIIGSIHRRCVQKISGRTTAENIGVHAFRGIDLPLPYERTFDLCVTSLEYINRCRIIQEDRFQGIITARTGINWKTWGDTVSCTLSRLNDDATHVTISSRPTARTTLVDFGKNLENVLLILSCLKNNGRAP